MTTIPHFNLTGFAQQARTAQRLKPYEANKYGLDLLMRVPLNISIRTRGGALFSKAHASTINGVLISPDGYAITNRHVLNHVSSQIFTSADLRKFLESSGKSFELKLSTRRYSSHILDNEPDSALALGAQLIAIDDKRDLALLKVYGADMEYLRFMKVDSGTVQPNDEVFFLTREPALQHTIVSPGQVMCRQQVDALLQTHKAYFTARGEVTTEPEQGRFTTDEGIQYYYQHVSGDHIVVATTENAQPGYSASPMIKDTTRLAGILSSGHPALKWAMQQSSSGNSWKYTNPAVALKASDIIDFLVTLGFQEQKIINGDELGPMKSHFSFLDGE